MCYYIKEGGGEFEYNSMYKERIKLKIKVKIYFTKSSIKYYEHE